MTNSAVDLDPRVGADEASQKAQQLLYNTLVHIDAASAAVNDEQRRALYGQVQEAVARDVPCIPLWYKTNVAVFQPGIHGVRLSPIADFTFLKHVYRSRAQ